MAAVRALAALPPPLQARAATLPQWRRKQPIQLLCHFGIPAATALPRPVAKAEAAAQATTTAYCYGATASGCHTEAADKYEATATASRTLTVHF